MRPPSRRISSEAVKFWSWGPKVGGRKRSPTCETELSHPRRRVSEERVPVCAAGPDQARPRSGNRRPILAPRPRLSRCLLNCRGIFRTPARCRRSPSGARRVRQAAMRSPEERARDPEPRPARGLGGQRETPRLHLRTVFEAVSRSSLLSGGEWSRLRMAFGHQAPRVLCLPLCQPNQEAFILTSSLSPKWLLELSYHHLIPDNRKEE
ncbi:uncharacterized protein LOC114908657 [Monodon monoceros]|uniref:uncharacterized protein LOC114908657 n=1 Tax=Monodon monoceros TaxID=40151 RepID=UPI0010F58914|nr:uncharacterized protein LOC114908657 [Monodon monoceros]